MLEKLKARFEIHFLAFMDPNLKPDPGCIEYSDTQTWVPLPYIPHRSARFALNLLSNLVASRLPLTLQQYQLSEMQSAIRKAATGADVVISDFLTASINFPREVASRSVLFQHNVEAEIWRRRANAESHPLKKIYLRDQHRRMQSAEKQLSEQFQRVVAVSETDASYFRNHYGLTNVSGAVPTGVDSDYFGEVRRAPSPGQLIFLGSMDWAPNIDAVDWLIDDILPLIRAACPTANLRVIGRKPPRSLVDKASAHPGIEFTGTVDDVRPYLEDAALALVPLRAGSGTRIKIFELMAAGVPVVSTPVGAEGLPVSHGEHIMLAESASDFASATASLLKDPETASRIARSASDLVGSRYGWGEIADAFIRLCR